VRVELRLFATLRSFLPPDSRDGVVFLDVPDGSTVRDVANRLGIPPDLERVALVNGLDRTPDTRLDAGDVVTLFPPLSGGR
jgi:sulfur-carrier protein